MQSVALILKRPFWVIVLCLALISFPLPSLAVTVQDQANINLLLSMGVEEVVAAVTAVVGNAGVLWVS